MDETWYIVPTLDSKLEYAKLIPGGFLMTLGVKGQNCIESPGIDTGKCRLSPALTLWKGELLAILIIERELTYCELKKLKEKKLYIVKLNGRTN